MGTAEHPGNPKFSVIIPAHNSAAYIRKALDSIREQSIADKPFTDYELIVVCDNCNDNTVEIATEYTDKVYCVGYCQDGQTRNVGIECATGEWILFLDDDDWFLHPYVFHMLSAVVGKAHEDIVAFSFIWNNMGYARQSPNNTFYAVWNKAWRREFIGDTRFSGRKYTSDKDFHELMFAKRPRISYFDQPMVFYNFMREGSLSKEMKDKKIMWHDMPSKEGD